ncbi:dipeptidase [Christensenellaceae bacterium OttesenSCG-928-M15]|nr:dipeptidase [Christensenellaceae bacterium OttesenSCG-928-M15]
MAKIPVADAHCDFLYGMYELRFDIADPEKGQTIYLPYMKQGGVKLQFFAAWIDRSLKTPYLQQCLSMIDCYERMLEAHPDAFEKLTKAYSPTGDKIATVLTVEGGEAIEGSLAALRTLKRLGVSAMTLTWNHHNELAYAAMKRGAKGLTSLGKEAVAEMNRIGIALDVSHLSDGGIDDALLISKAPIFASHSNARAVYDTPRALCDDHIRAIKKQGGVIGVNFFHKQLCDGDASIRDIVRHMMHVIKIGGIECCCIGSDFDGMTQYPRDLQNCSYLQDLLGALRAEGLGEEDLYKIAYGNLYDYIVQFI